MAFWHGAHSDKCLFQVIITGSTPVSLLESKWVLKLSRNFRTEENDHLHIYSLWYTPGCTEYVRDAKYINTRPTSHRFRFPSVVHAAIRTCPFKKRPFGTWTPHSFWPVPAVLLSNRVNPYQFCLMYERRYWDFYQYARDILQIYWSGHNGLLWFRSFIEFNQYIPL
jgi:hypothetical protein